MNHIRNMNRRSRSPIAAAVKTRTAPTRAKPAAEKSRLRERFRAETRDAILSAAELALADQGARGAKMELIAAKAGIAVGTLYNYFADRQELIDALFELRRRELIGRLDTALSDTLDAPFERQLEAFLGAALSHFRDHREFFTLVVHDQLSAEQGSRWSMILELRRRAERLIQGGIDAGLLRPGDRAMYPHLLTGLLRGVVEIALAAAPRAPTGALLAPAVRCFLSGAGQSA